MDFSLPPEYEQLKQSVRKFLERELDPISRELDEKQQFPFEVYREAAELGFVGPHLPAEYGGSGDLWAKAVIYEEMTYHNLGFNISLNASDLLFANNIAKFGTPTQKERYIPPIVRGTKHGCFGLSEPEAGSDALALKTTWRKDGEHYVISGQKTFISNAPIADFFLVYARAPGTKKLEGGCAFILERGMDGLETGKPFDKLGCRCSPTGEIFMDDVRVDRLHLLGEEGEGIRLLLQSLDIERALTPFSSIGVSQACLDAAAKYAKERRQFGRPIADFQLIKEKLAEMSMQIELARTYAYKLIWLVLQGRRITKEAAMLKLFASQMVNRIAYEALQIFGGYGYMKEYPVERYFRDARVLEIGAGTSEIQKLVIARELLKEY